jgi:hypothetical protein
MSRRDWPRCSECANVVRDVQGDYPGKRIPEPDGRCSAHRLEDTLYAPPEIAQTDDAAEPEAELTLDESPAAVERIESLRDAMRGDLLTGEVADLIRLQLLDALRAVKQQWTTCPHCQKRHSVPLADLATRINAASKLIEEVDGKLAAQQETAQSALEREATKLTRSRAAMSDSDLALRIVMLEADLAADRA